jgi:hypothetical protein
MMDPKLQIAAIALAAAAVAAPARAHRHGPTSTSSDHVRSCADLHVQFGDRGARNEEQTLTIPGGARPALRVAASENGGVWVAGSDRSDFSVRVCKAVPDDADGKKTLSQIQARVEDGSLRVEGPDDADWVAQVIVEAPRNAGIAISGVNGPIGVRDVAGSVSIEAENGPVDCKACTGATTIRSHNGPVDLRGSAGKLEADVENGPVTVALSGGAWSGSGARITCRNGPLTLRVPDGYASGVLLEMSEHSPFHCRGVGCSLATRSWDDDSRSMRLGKGETVIRLSTDNGPVRVEAGG